VSRRWWPADRRFLRWAVPLAVIVVLFTVTGVTWAINRVTPADPDFLEPASTAGVGAHTAARRLLAAGISVRRYGSSRGALAAAAAGDRTVLVTAPDYMAPGYVYELFGLPSSDRIVLVAPSALLLSEHGLPIRRTGSRWTTGSADPGCRGQLATGRAAVVGARYSLDRPRAGTVCYGGGLVRMAAASAPELVVIGAPDVLRNDRIAEQRNAALANALLSSRAGVVWLSLHHPETTGTSSDHQPSISDTGYPTSGRHGDQQAGNGGSGSDQGNGGASSSGGGSTPNPLWSTFPPWLWAITVQLLIAAVLLAMWRARRLGPPVPEPLPVVVRAGETVTGRARLYQRARARPEALDSLRSGALRRLLPLLELGPDPGRRGIVAALAERSGWPPERVDAALYGVVPDTDAELHAAVAELDLLVWLVHEEREGTAGARTV
jgi:uncharacterized membrane protein YgcG